MIKHYTLPVCGHGVDSMEKLPREWVERIFERLECVYKERWAIKYNDPAIRDLLITQWSSGLAGLSSNEIRKALAICERYPYDAIPTVIEFYHYAKGYRQPSPIPPPHYLAPERKELALGYMSEIKSKLKSVPRRTSQP